jgi:hypothetical protein
MSYNIEYKQSWINCCVDQCKLDLYDFTQQFTIEQLRYVVEKHIICPEDNRWYGEVTRKLQKQGLITKLDKSASAISSNYSQKPLWVRTDLLNKFQEQTEVVVVDATEELFLDPSLTIPDPDKSLVGRFKAFCQRLNTMLKIGKSLD